MNGGQYKGVMLSYLHGSVYFIMDVYKDIKIYAYGHQYSDAGGTSGGDAKFERWNGSQFEEYKTAPTNFTGERYELVTLEKGRYKITSTGNPNNYVNFDEWEVERIN